MCWHMSTHAAPRKRHSALLVYISRDQLRELKREAGSLHLNVSDYVRAKLLGVPARGLTWVKEGYWRMADLPGVKVRIPEEG
jgi:hypothetical protein